LEWIDGFVIGEQLKEQFIKLCLATFDQYSQDVTGQWNKVLLSRE
jgi:hypothetical protein